MNIITKITSLLVLGAMTASVSSVAQKKDPITLIPVDYSYCGYRMSAEMIPGVPVKVTVPAGKGDQSQKIQRAIDYVSSLQPDKVTGFRGAVLLAEGTYELDQPLRISTSGVVLRGSSRNATKLVK
ncbi:MAG: pectate lyase, partial [Bacteroidales bacterium]|nr:pectate lyase [Bacteroidales bacterium]